MKILGLDTAMAACSVAVVDAASGAILAAAFQTMERGHAEALAPMVVQVMHEAGLPLSAIDRIAVTIGPGTFTGVRIGLALARGLGLALGIPVAGIDTLTAIAANDTSGMPLFVVSEARNGEVYAALFDGRGHQLIPPRVMTRAEVGGYLPPSGLLLGTAAQSVLAASGRNDLRISPAGNLPVARVFAGLAAVSEIPAAMPSPLYLRSPDAKPQSAPLRRAASLVFRQVNPTGATVLAAMHAEAFDTGWSADEFAKLLAMPGAKVVIASEYDEPAGFVLSRMVLDEAEIITICTRPVAQRRGVARSLLNHLFTDLLADGITQVFIEVAASNQAARALYDVSGFKQAGQRANYYKHADGSMDDAIVMRRGFSP